MEPVTPVSHAELGDAIHDHAVSSTTVAGPFGPLLLALVDALLPALVAFLHSRFAITPKV